MNDDDPRHGSKAGYVAGCRSICCRDAVARYERHRTHADARGIPRRLSPVGTHRRIRALIAFGWTRQDIANECGWSRDRAISEILGRDWILVKTHKAIARAYNSMSMRPGPSEQGRRTAARKGWPLPLQWDDATIDDPRAEPYRSRRRTTIDPDTGQVLQPTTTSVEQSIVDDVIVDRAMNGQKVEANEAERHEIIRRWEADGRSLNSLVDVQGWNVWLYKRRAAA